MKAGDLVKIIWPFEEPDVGIFIKFDEREQFEELVWIFWDNHVVPFNFWDNHVVPFNIESTKLEVLSESR